MLTEKISGRPRPGYGCSAQVQISHITTPKLKTSTFSFTRSSCSSCMPLLHHHVIRQMTVTIDKRRQMCSFLEVVAGSFSFSVT